MTEFLNQSMETLRNISPFKGYQERCLIDYIARKKTATIEDISKYDTSANLVDALENLEDKGFVKLKSNEEKKNIESASITEKGLNVYEQSKEITPKINALTKILEPQ